MATKLTKKEKGFVKDYLETGNGVQSALANYDTEDYHTAGAIAHENLKKPKIQQALEEALPDEILLEIHREGLYAMKPFFDKDGNKLAEDADYGVRYKYLDLAHKLKGHYVSEDAPKEINRTTYNFVFSKEVQDDVKEIEAKIKARLINHVPET